MQITQSYATQNECYKCAKKLYIKKLMVHSTACPGVMAAAFAKAWNVLHPNNRQVCVHGFIDDTSCYQLLPWEIQAWHCGGSGNQQAIGIEICEPKQYSDKEYFEKAIKNAIEVYAYLCETYGVDPSNIISHAEGYKFGIASNHSDVAHWWCHVGYTMDDFRADVRECLNSGSAKVSYTGKKAPGTSKAETAAGGAASGDIVYQTYTKDKEWLPDVINFNNVNSNGFAGWIGLPIYALRANIKGAAEVVGYLESRLHRLGGDWYNWQRDRQMDGNGENYAGDCKNEFDGLQMCIVGVSGKHVRYRVHAIGIGWLEWITDYGDGDNGYAGIYGCAIDAVQIEAI